MNFPPVDVMRFDGALGGDVVLDARWRILATEGKDLAANRSVLTQPTGGPGYPAVVAAMSRAAAALSREIAATLDKLPRTGADACVEEARPSPAGDRSASPPESSSKSCRRACALAAGLLALLGLACGLPACGTLSAGRGWGEDVIYPVSEARIGEAALHAAFGLQTLLRAAGAGLCATVDHWDQRVSTWATTHHPLFGSTDAAKTAADATLGGRPCDHI